MHRPQVRSGSDNRSCLQNVLDRVICSSTGDTHHRWHTHIHRSHLQLPSLCSMPAMPYGKRKLACCLKQPLLRLCSDEDSIGSSKVSKDSCDTLSGTWRGGWEKPSRRPRKLRGGCGKLRHPHKACACPQRCAVHLYRPYMHLDRSPVSLQHACAAIILLKVTLDVSCIQ